MIYGIKTEIQDINETIKIPIPKTVTLSNYSKICKLVELIRISNIYRINLESSAATMWINVCAIILKSRFPRQNKARLMKRKIRRKTAQVNVWGLHVLINDASVIAGCTAMWRGVMRGGNFSWRLIAAHILRTMVPRHIREGNVKRTLLHPLKHIHTAFNSSLKRMLTWWILHPSP